MFKFSKNSIKNLRGVKPELLEIFSEAIKVTPIDFGIPKTGGLRSTEQQRLLFDTGASKADGVRNKSKHQYGKAVDVFAYVNWQESWDERHLSLIAGVVMSIANKKGVEIRWGGTFGSNNLTGWDMPHFELL